MAVLEVREIAFVCVEVLLFFVEFVAVLQGNLGGGIVILLDKRDMRSRYRFVL